MDNFDKIYSEALCRKENSSMLEEGTLIPGPDGLKDVVSNEIRELLTAVSKADKKGATTAVNKMFKKAKRIGRK